MFTGSSRGYIKGLIDISRSAKGTDTFLGEFSMLLAKTARLSEDEFRRQFEYLVAHEPPPLAVDEHGERLAASKG